MIRKLAATWASDRARVFFLALALIASSALIIPVHSIGQEPSAKISAGERVALRGGQSALRLDDRELVRSRRENHFYRVEAVSGPSLTLRSENDCIAGVIPSSDVVLVSQGIDFFMSQIEANQEDGFAYLMALVALVG